MIHSASLIRKYRNETEHETEQPESSYMTQTIDYVSRVRNRIYFYSDIEDVKVLQLNKILFETSTSIISDSVITNSSPTNLYLHVNSLGGSFFSGISAMDEILRINETTPITTIVDGVAASAATFMTMVGAHRQIKRHSFMLIHQISSGFWGTYEEFKDEEENLTKFMELLKSMYKTYTKLPVKKLNEILKRDLFLTAEEALTWGLVDEII